MTGFLGQLAAMALGANSASAARVSLPSRFASPAPLPGIGEQGFSEVERSEPVSVVVPPVPQRGTAPSDAPASVSERRPEEKLPEEAPAPTPPYQREPTPRLVARAATPPLAPQQRADREQGMRQHIGIPAPVADRPAARATGPSAPLLLLPQIARGAPGTPTAQRPATPTAPLSEGAVAGRALPPRAQAPVIHVTIDRLDVRAAAPAKSAAPARRPRPEPAVSLADYLRDGARGGRG
jgi:hypothetical protein